MKKVIFLGAHPRVGGIINLYGLQQTGGFDICDRQDSTSRVGGYRVIKNKNCTPVDYQHVIITEDPSGLFKEAIDYLLSKGFERSQVITMGEPGKLHRCLRAQPEIKLSDFSGL